MPNSDEMQAPPPIDASAPKARARAGAYREVTVAAVLFAIVVGVVMNASITYAGLKIGFTIVGSSIAAVLGFGILRGLGRIFNPNAGSIVETNIAQTVASAVNTSNSGVIFTVPVLFLIGVSLSWNDIDFWLITLACIAGAILGTAFIIPLRKQMIDIDRLRFPSGTGVAAILKSPGAGVKKTLVLVAGIVLAAAIYAPSGLPAIERAVTPERISGDQQRSFEELLQTARVGADDTFDALDHLVYDERLSVSRAQYTRDLQGWIADRSVPETVRERGALLLEGREKRAALAEAKDALAERPVPEEARVRVRALKAEIADLDARLANPDIAPPHGAPDDWIIAAAEAQAGERAWESLQSTKAGWAGDPLFGYQDLQVRLPDYRDESGDTHPRLDRNDNGRPDLLVTDMTVDVGRWLNLPDQYQLVFAIAPFALGAGFITGRAGLMVLAGGILAYFVLNPVAYQMGWLPATTQAHQAPGAAFTSFNRPLGIGMLLGGAFMGVLASLPAIKEALRSVARAGRAKGGRDELGLAPLIFAAVAAVGLLFLAADFVGNKPLNEGGLDPITSEQVTAEADPATFRGYAIAFSTIESAQTWASEGTGPDGTVWDDQAKNAYLESLNARPGWLADFDPHLRALIIALIGAVWMWFAGVIIAQCTGMTDWSPISGMALLTVVLVLLLAGSGSVVGAVLIGASLCVAITLAADMMADLRTGHLVGSKPARQQATELALVGIGPIVCMLTLLLIAQVNLQQTGAAFGPGTPTVAPQAQALQAVIQGVQGGELPYFLYLFGAILGALLGLGSFAGLGVLVGLSVYLPFIYIATYGIGCVANIVLGAFKGRRWTEEWGVPFAAGLIVGESILALILNIYVLATG